MSDVVIKVENISKQYRLGNVGTGSLAHDLNRTWHRMRGKEDPYLKIGEANDRSVKGNSEYVWALQDINFEVKQGEVLGIIGRNGAGKSTLLKILSRTTTPTTGQIKIKGRVASLLEVGTGFHPELTGRENIFLNGAILGMTKSEIKRKFDEIVDFAGVERYIDTPVKRYSSGMYVRLAFGVAAHLEPEILIVDEVLAVGDAEFQKKALGKMKDVSEKDGRTVLFVSHNMAAVSQLTDNCILLNNGKIFLADKTENVLSEYSKVNEDKLAEIAINTEEWIREIDIEGSVLITSMSFTNTNIIKENSNLAFNLNFKILSIIDFIRVSMIIHDLNDTAIGSSFSKEYEFKDLDKSTNLEICLPKHNLAPGKYYITIGIGKGNQHTGYCNYDALIKTLHFEIIPDMILANKSNSSVWHKSWGTIHFDDLLISSR